MFDLFKCCCCKILSLCVLPAEVTQFENGSFWVDEQVLGLDVSVTNALGMDISQTTKQLVHVHLRRSQHKQKNTRSPVYTVKTPRNKKTKHDDNIMIIWCFVLLWKSFRLME